jgi:hypothetical protein
MSGQNKRKRDITAIEASKRARAEANDMLLRTVVPENWAGLSAVKKSREEIAAAEEQDWRPFAI